jgi:hypothetical protein
LTAEPEPDERPPQPSIRPFLEPDWPPPADEE